MNAWSPVVIQGDVFIIVFTLVTAVGCFGLFVLKVADKWNKRAKRKSKSPKASADQLLN